MLTVRDRRDRRQAAADVQAAAERAADVRRRAAQLTIARAEADAVGARLAERLAPIGDERARGRRLTGSALRAAVVEALTYAGESDPADRLRVHLVETDRGTLADVQAAAAGLSGADWGAIGRERSAWQRAEGVGDDRPGRGISALASAATVEHVSALIGSVGSVPGRGPAHDRTEFILGSALAYRREGRTASAWSAWCSDRGMSRAAACRWWSRAAAYC